MDPNKKPRNSYNSKHTVKEHDASKGASFDYNNNTIQLKRKIRIDKPNYIQIADYEVHIDDETIDNNFKTLFDLPTPRPHFIFKRRKQIECKNQLLKFLDSTNEQEIKDLLQVASKFTHKNDNISSDDVIFSLHTGFFCSSDEFHAHLCVNTDAYLECFKSNKPDEIKFRPTKQWDIKDFNKDIKTAYIENVLNFESKTKIKYSKYKLDDIMKLEKNKINYNYENSAVKSTCFQGIDIILHEFEPKVGFKCNEKKKTDIEQFYIVLQAMKDFAIQKGYFDKSKGSHLCLYINKISKEFNVDGYILLAADEFYQLLPTIESRELWLEKFKNTTYWVET